jgi:hypothetical protein
MRVLSQGKEFGSSKFGTSGKCRPRHAGGSQEAGGVPEWRFLDENEREKWLSTGRREGSSPWKKSRAILEANGPSKLMKRSVVITAWREAHARAVAAWLRSAARCAAAERCAVEERDELAAQAAVAAWVGLEARAWLQVVALAARRAVAALDAPEAQDAVSRCAPGDRLWWPDCFRAEHLPDDRYAHCLGRRCACSRDGRCGGALRLAAFQ